MNHIFTSHCHEDVDFAENLEHKLTEAGLTVWRDVLIRGGDDYRKKIDEAIRDSSALIVIMTPEAKASEYVTYEWAFAWGAGVKVIPILRKKTILHPRLESLQYLDFTDRQNRPWDELIGLLREAEAAKPQEEMLPEKNEEIKIENAQEKAAYQRMIAALSDENWTWRSINKLSAIGGVAEEKALDILRLDSNVIFGKGRSGRQIARLKSR